MKKNSIQFFRPPHLSLNEEGVDKDNSSVMCKKNRKDSWLKNPFLLEICSSKTVFNDGSGQVRKVPERVFPPQERRP
jgi:hypothetical protein